MPKAAPAYGSHRYAASLAGRYGAARRNRDDDAAARYAAELPEAVAAASIKRIIEDLQPTPDQAARLAALITGVSDG